MEIDPSAFIIVPAPRANVGSLRLDGRLLTVRTCPACGVKTVIPGPCVLCNGDNVVAPSPPEESSKGSGTSVDPFIAALLGQFIDTSARDSD